MRMMKKKGKRKLAVTRRGDERGASLVAGYAGWIIPECGSAAMKQPHASRYPEVISQRQVPLLNARFR